MPQAHARTSRLVRLAVLPAAALLLAALAVPAVAQQPTRGEQAVKYRKALYQVMAWNMGPMSAMAQGKAPYNASEFARRADRVAAVAPMLYEAYPAESQAVKDTKMKPEAWTNRADFDAKMKTMVESSGALATVAKTGDEAKTRSAYADLGNACKSCHDKYKAD